MVARYNNFDFLRVFFASLVIFSHSFPLTGNTEILSIISKNQIDLGKMAVQAFFVMSGFLIFNSLKNSSSHFNFLWKRVLRLFPGLFVLLIITLIILPFFNNKYNLFLEKSYWTYLPKNMTLFKVQYKINGVFENNPYPKAINGSLWSLCYEFTMYLFMLIFFSIRKYKFIIAVILIAFISSYFLYINNSTFLSSQFKFIFLDSVLLFKLSTYFFAGSLLNFVDLDRIRNIFFGIILIVGIVLSIYLNCYDYVAPFFLPLIIILLGTSFNAYLNYLPNKLGDLSYGVYIYGFFIQQCIMNYLNVNTLFLFIISLFLTYIISYLSWHYVEKMALKYKNYF